MLLLRSCICNVPNACLKWSNSWVHLEVIVWGKSLICLIHYELTLQIFSFQLLWKGIRIINEKPIQFQGKQYNINNAMQFVPCILWNQGWHGRKEGEERTMQRRVFIAEINTLHVADTVGFIFDVGQINTLCCLVGLHCAVWQWWLWQKHRNVCRASTWSKCHKPLSWRPPLILASLRFNSDALFSWLSCRPADSGHPQREGGPAGDRHPHH